MKRAILAALVSVALGGCIGETDATAEPTTEATPDATAEPTATPEPTAEPTPISEPTPSASQTADGSFVPATNAEADALFIDRDDCQNLRDGYQLVYPDSWYTNTPFRDVAACSWFSPTFYEVDDSTDVPDEIAITIEWVPGGFGWHESELRFEQGMVAGQAAARVELEDSYFYVIQLGPTAEEGPNLVARTSREMGGDYELNKAVLDRMMLTIEFVGSTQ